MRATIKMIAERAGVSIGTVDRAIKEAGIRCICLWITPV